MCCNLAGISHLHRAQLQNTRSRSSLSLSCCPSLFRQLPPLLTRLPLQLRLHLLMLPHHVQHIIVPLLLGQLQRGAPLPVSKLLRARFKQYLDAC